MKTIALRSSSRGRDLRRGLAVACAAVVAAATLGMSLTAAPASAAPKDPCATARAVFRSYMNEARFWIGAADRLAGAGNQSGANGATAEANYYLGLAKGALGGVSAAC
jgi:hypothetical protein